MKEQQIQNKIIKHLEKLWFFMLNLTITNKNWIPDLLATKNWECFWIEVKKEKWVLSEIQKYRIRELEKNWDIVIIPYWFQDFLDKFEKTPFSG